MITFPCNYDELEIVGFDGTTRAVCGRYLPLVRHKPSDQFFKLSSRNETHQSRPVYTRDEVEHFNAQGRITSIPSPVPAFHGAMVIYTSRELFNSVERHKSSLDWQEIESQGWVACTTEDKAERYLNSVAWVIMAKATEELLVFFATQADEYQERAERLMKMARTAACEKTLKARVYVRYGLTLKFSKTPERLDNVYQLRISREFPNWTWETFQMRIMRLTEMLQDQALTKNIKNKEQLDSVYMLTIINRSLSNLKPVDKTNMPHQCRTVAETFRDLYPVQSEDIEEVGRKLFTTDRLRLDDNNLRVLAGEPIFYYLYSQKPLDLKVDKPRPVLLSSDYIRSSTEFIEIGGEPGQVDRYIGEAEEAASVAVYA